MNARDGLRGRNKLAVLRVREHFALEVLNKSSSYEGVLAVPSFDEVLVRIERLWAWVVGDAESLALAKQISDLEVALRSASDRVALLEMEADIATDGDAK